MYIVFARYNIKKRKMIFIHKDDTRLSKCAYTSYDVRGQVYLLKLHVHEFSTVSEAVSAVVSRSKLYMSCGNDPVIRFSSLFNDEC